MRIYELLNSYYFHDSLIEEVKYFKEKEKVVIKMDFCNWLQPNYKEKEPEILECTVTFQGITHCNPEPCTLNLDSDQILDINSDSEENSNDCYIEFVLMGNDDVKLLKLSGEAIECFYEVN